jgi:hypothetical protein
VHQSEKQTETSDPHRWNPLKTSHSFITRSPHANRRPGQSRRRNQKWRREQTQMKQFAGNDIKTTSVSESAMEETATEDEENDWGRQSSLHR